MLVIFISEFVGRPTRHHKNAERVQVSARRSAYTRAIVAVDPLRRVVP